MQNINLPKVIFDSAGKYGAGLSLESSAPLSAQGFNEGKL